MTRVVSSDPRLAEIQAEVAVTPFSGVIVKGWPDGGFVAFVPDGRDVLWIGHFDDIPAALQAATEVLQDRVS